MTLSELDLRNEIKGVDMLNKTLNNHRDFLSKTVSHTLTFPEFITELSSEKILVSERLTGKSFRELLDSGNLPYLVLIDFFFQHVFMRIFIVATYSSKIIKYISSIMVLLVLHLRNYVMG
jgi:predicted unusual protein kinase regulating ubiquinone biosynthesis (AarF/ABC1/UbiB family)